MQHSRGLSLLALAVISLVFSSNHVSGGPVRLVDAFPHLSFTKPIFLTNSGDGTNRLFIVQQNGLILVFDNDSSTTSASVFLNVSGRLSSANGEEGLLGLAFHPQYASNGIFFINYTAPNPLRTVVARYHVSTAAPSIADTAGEVILEVNQPYSNHNGGMLAFGPDGYLYIGLGDGGSGGDPLNNAQSLTTLLGKILRIDVNGQSQDRKYAIPPDNPFAGNASGYREEIWAYGLRNPWRFGFDRLTGQLWGGDVGQGAWEEVDIIEKGKNYGWRTMEGFACYNSSSGCDTTGLTMPLHVYSHSEGVSITGGYVYRGTRCPDLAGTYVFGDFGSRRVWTLPTTRGSAPSDSSLLTASGLVSSFGEDESGELYVVTYSYGTPTKIYRFDQFMPTSTPEAALQPVEFRLEQNFPNPFNPTTRIRYSAGVVSRDGLGAAKVRLAVYDLLGRQVAVLVDGQREPGMYTVEFDGTHLSAGVYFCRMQVGGLSPVFDQTRSLVLVK